MHKPAVQEYVHNGRRKMLGMRSRTQVREGKGKVHFAIMWMFNIQCQANAPTAGRRHMLGVRSRMHKHSGQVHFVSM